MRYDFSLGFPYTILKKISLNVFTIQASFEGTGLQDDTKVSQENKCTSPQEAPFLQLQQPCDHWSSSVSDNLFIAAETGRCNSDTRSYLPVLLWCISNLVRSLFLRISREDLQKVSLKGVMSRRCCCSLGEFWGHHLPRTQTSLSQWKCARKGRQDGDNGLRLPSEPFPLSLAVLHQSLAFRARLYQAKNEAAEEEAGSLLSAFAHAQNATIAVWKRYEKFH